MTRRRVAVICIIGGIVLVLGSVGLLVYNLEMSFLAERNATNVLTYLDQVLEEEADKEEHGPEMDTVLIDGNLYIGKLSIPRFGLELPVMDEWSYEGLNTAPGRYSGSVWTNDLVICGHNYSRHFEPLLVMNEGDTVLFTDVHDNVFTYEVGETEILQPTAIEEMIDSKWDLTLFTCTFGGQTRMTIRCTLVEGPTLEG